MEPFFNACEDPDLVDLEMELPPDELGMLPAFEGMAEVGFEALEMEELGNLQEEFETVILEDVALGEQAELDADALPALEAPETISMDEASPLDLDALIKAMKQYPGLKITLSF